MIAIKQAIVIKLKFSPTQPNLLMHLQAMQHLLNISISQSPIKITCFQSFFTSPAEAPFLILHIVFVAAVVVPICVLRMGWKVAPSSSPSALFDDSCCCCRAAASASASV